MINKYVIVTYSIGFGGAEKRALSFFNYLKSHTSINEVFLVVFKRNSYGEQKFNIDLSSDNVIYLDETFGIKGYLALKSSLNKIKPTHVMGFLGHINVMLGKMKKSFSNTVIGGRENAVYSTYFKEKKYIGFIIKMMYKKNLNKLDYIVAQSNYMKKELVIDLNVPAEKIYIQYNPLPFSNNRNNNYSSNISNAKEDTVRLFAVGRLDKVKNYTMMLDILKRLPRNYELTIAGDGNERDFLLAYSKQIGVFDRVTFLGNVENVIERYRDFDLLLLTSLRESSPNVVLEATSQGLYTISFNMPGGISEVVFEEVNGSLIEFGNIDDYVAQVLKNVGRNATIPEKLLSEEKYNRELYRLMNGCKYE